MEIKNLELLAKAGLEAVTDTEGNVTIQKKEEVLENGGKWLPKEGSQYFVVFEEGCKTIVHSFFNFKPGGDFEKRHLRNGIVFPTQEMAERVAKKYVNAIKEEWDEYEKKINALNGGQDDESES